VQSLWNYWMLHLNLQCLSALQRAWPRPAIPWSNAIINLIGPWKVSIGGRDLIIKTVTAIDVVWPTLAETIWVYYSTGVQGAIPFENCWLVRYPRPIQAIHNHQNCNCHWRCLTYPWRDHLSLLLYQCTRCHAFRKLLACKISEAYSSNPRPEFTAPTFQVILICDGIKPVPIAIKNLQANDICCEWINYVYYLPQQSSSRHSWRNWCYGFRHCFYSIRFMSCHPLSPWSFTFQHDLLHPIPILANFDLVHQWRQTLID
jgi:hypothetical protein